MAHRRSHIPGLGARKPCCPPAASLSFLLSPRRRGRLRGRRGTDRRLRALFLVHGRDRDLSQREQTDPAIGERGQEERVRELRLETVYPAEREDDVVQALRDAHPYEEPAFDLYQLLPSPLPTDGGARGNPGPAAYGYVLETEDGTVLAAHGEAIGVATNNVAEYTALVEGLRKAAEVGVGELEVVSDSELLVHQMRGEWKIKNEALRMLWEEAQDLAAGIGKVRYTAVRREHNELADRLVNEALDAAG